MSGSQRFQVGIDIGGTFTDLVMVGSDGQVHSRKLLSTPDDYGRGIVDGLTAALAAAMASPAQVERVVHATTVATNAILERKGARTALITTSGFRDVLEMRRLRIPEMYTLNWPKPEPLVPRRLRLEVVERVGPRGEVWEPLDDLTVHAAAARLGASNVEAIAVSLLHAYANPSHERRVQEILRDVLGKSVFITCSSDILPIIREYERTSTTVINAYLGPILKKYFASLQWHLAAIGVTAPLHVMKSDGGIMTVAAAMEKPAYIVESGPAAGVIGAASLSKALLARECITLDMGGTTAKASIVENGQVTRTGDYEVGAGINLSSKLVMGGGYALKLPVVDVSEIGAGGGSLVSIDSGGLLRVGPKSAGSLPGPVAYDLGGEDPTFTDAVLALGYLNPDYLVGGSLRLNADAACRALADRIAGPLGKTLLETAYGVYEVACGTMIRAVKAVSTYRGRDPRDFTLFAFGGNGPVVAAHLADMMEMRHVVIPPSAGVFSAFGLLVSDLEHEMAQGYLRPLDEAAAAELVARFALLEESVAALLQQDRVGTAAAQIMRLADLRYAGQAHELTVPVPTGHIDVAGLAKAFGDEHERNYGHRADAESVECVTLRVIGRLAVGHASLLGPLRPSGEEPTTIAAGSRSPAAVAYEASKAKTRRAFFGANHGLVDTPVIQRADLASDGRPGPLIIEEYDTTAVVPPGWAASRDQRDNIYLHAEGMR
jgi:N-methylhydantoinase A